METEKKIIIKIFKREEKNDRIFFGGAQLDLSVRNKKKEAMIWNFTNVERGNGDGTILLQRVCKLADKLGFTLALRTESYNHQYNTRLVEFYIKFGFSPVSTNVWGETYMERQIFTV